MSELELVKAPFCMKCGKQIANKEEEFCKDCLLEEKTYKRGFPLLKYDKLSSGIMYDIKYKNKRYYTKIFANLIYLRWGKEIKKLGIDCLMPIPIHKKRLRERTYNQAELLASYLSQYLGIEMETYALYRHKNTKAQKELSKKERFKNLKEAFSCDLSYTNKYKKVLLVDDIYTTGSTIEACSLALKEIGVKEVYYTAICIA